MPINNTTPIISYLGNGVSNTFAFNFKIFKAADLVLTIDGVLKVFGADYALTGVGSITGGNLVAALAPANLAKVVIYRQVSYDRLVPDYQEGGDFLANTIDDDIDRVVAQVQQIARDLGRAIKLPIDVTADQTIVSTAAQRIGKIAGFDSSGNAALFDPSLLGSATVSAFMAGVIVAANVAAAQAALGVYSTAQVDSTFIAKAFIDAKGDLIGGSADNTPARIVAGANGLQLIADSVLANGVGYEVRNLERSQCPVSGVQDANGNANFLTTGAGLRPGLTATAAALLLAFGNGYDNGGNIDQTSLLTADVGDILGANLPVSNTSFLSATYVGPAGVTWGSTLAPPQHARVYDQTKQSVLQFGGVAGSTVFLDDFGNTWAAQGGAKVQTNQIKFGTGALGGAGAANVLNGAADYIKTTGAFSLGGGSWAVRAWCYPTTLPGAGFFGDIIDVTTAANIGTRLAIWNNGGTIKFWYGLGNAAAGDIASQQGTTTPIVNNWYFVELTFDALAGVYRLYVNGAQEASTASAVRVNNSTTAAIGSALGAANSFFAGYIDKPEILPYCQHPAGTAYAVPVAAPSVTAAGYASDFYNIVTRKMFGVTAASGVAGTAPTLTAKSLVYAGEADTSGAAVTAVRSYAYKGRYVSPDTTIPAVGINTAFASNIGNTSQNAAVYLRNYVGEGGWSAGSVIPVVSPGTTRTTLPTGITDRNILNVITGSSAVFQGINKTNGTEFSVTAASWKMFVVADRGF